MFRDKPTQKSISQSYDGAVDYPRRPHYFRRLRGWLFAAAVVVSLAGAFGFGLWGRSRSYSPGPISQNHARFTNDCRVCHLDADDAFLKLGKLALGAPAPSGNGPANPVPGAFLARMDEACIRCHETTRLHLPQAASVGIRAISNQLTVVHASNCATCHREHVSHERMALPGAQACISCHNNPEKLATAWNTVKIGHTAIGPGGENRDLGDGVVRFLTPARGPGSLRPFASFAAGHPPFDYEQPGVRDPTALLFNHHTPLRVITHRLDCASCHEPGADGIYMQPVNYERHCAQCHSLQFQPSLPKLRIPHGDSEKVRYFLASREISFELALRAEGIDDPVVLKQRIQLEMQALSRRGLDNLNDLEQRVFFEGDPKDLKPDRLLRAGDAKFLTECAKCHVVSPGSADHAPIVAAPKMPERWMQHGPFTHLPHQHMKCLDCHGAAPASALTSDILLPSQKLCAECHRAPAPAAEHQAAPRGNVFDLAQAQRDSGGVKWDCTICHGFHAPPDAQAMIEAIVALPHPRGPSK